MTDSPPDNPTDAKAQASDAIHPEASDVTSGATSDAPLAQSPQPMSHGKRWRRRLWRGGLRAMLLSLVLVVLYVGIHVVGLMPVNRDFVEADEGVTIYFASGTVHTDIVVPLRNDVFDWWTVLPADAFPTGMGYGTHAAMGWGDRGFFMETPEWGDLKVTTAANAMLWPSRPCMHVWLTRPEWFVDGVPSVTITEAQYRELVDFLLTGYALDDEKIAVSITLPGYDDHDAFFVSHGWYHGLNTCNTWTAKAIRAAGITAPRYTTLPKVPLRYLD